MSAIRSPTYRFKVIGEDGRLRDPEPRPQGHQATWDFGIARWDVTIWTYAEWAQIPEHRRLCVAREIPGIGWGVVLCRVNA